MEMDFTGALNFSSNTGEPQLGITTPISDARPLFGKHSQGNAQGILLNGRGFLLANSLSTVINWSDPKEVANKYYEEALTLAQNFLPDFRFMPINSHTFRDESIKEHHWIDGIQQRPCAVRAQRLRGHATTTSDRSRNPLPRSWVCLRTNASLALIFGDL